MATFLMTLVSPERLLFAEQVEQTDLPGLEGDFGVLSGHAPIVAMLRPGLITAISGNERSRFVVRGGVAEFSNEVLTVLAEAVASVEEFDLAGLKAEIEEMQQTLAQTAPGEALDRAVAQLDHYKSIHAMLTLTTAF